MCQQACWPSLYQTKYRLYHFTKHVQHTERVVSRTDLKEEKEREKKKTEYFNYKSWFWNVWCWSLTIQLMASQRHRPARTVKTAFMSLRWRCAFLFGMTVPDLKACQTPLALYFPHKLLLLLFFWILCIFHGGNSCCRSDAAVDYMKNVHNRELAWQGASSLPCSISFHGDARVLRRKRIQMQNSQ